MKSTPNFPVTPLKTPPVTGFRISLNEDEKVATFKSHSASDFN